MFSCFFKLVNIEKNGFVINCDVKLFENFDSKFVNVGVFILCKGFYVFRGVD